MKLVFHSSTIAMMHGPITIRFRNLVYRMSVEFRVACLPTNFVAVYEGRLAFLY